MRNFASTLVKFSKLSHIQTTIWRPTKMAPPALRRQRALCYATAFNVPVNIFFILQTLLSNVCGDKFNYSENSLIYFKHKEVFSILDIPIDLSFISNKSYT